MLKCADPGKEKIDDISSPPLLWCIHLRHSALTRLGEAGADAFTIRTLAGHSSVTISERYVHPTGETVELAFDRLEALNRNVLKAANGKK